MCAHIGQNRHIYRRVYTGYILTRYPLPLFRRLTVGAAIEKNFFYFFVTSFLFGFVLYFIQNICVLTRLYLLDIISITIPDFASEFRLVFLASISTCFSIVYSTLYLLNYLILLLVINKHLCLYEFVLCLFWLF